MARLEDLTPGARVTGVVAGQAVTVVAVQWHGTAALTLTFRDDAGRPGEQLLYRDSESQLAVEAPGQGLVPHRRRRALPPRQRGAPHPARLPLRPAARGQQLQRDAAAAPDLGGLRGDAHPPAAALPARRRPRRRQDHHGRPAHQGADGARRRQARAHRLPGHARRPVAGRAAREVPPRLRDRHAADDRRLVRAATRSSRRTC